MSYANRPGRNVRLRFAKFIMAQGFKQMSLSLSRIEAVILRGALSYYRSAPLTDLDATLNVQVRDLISRLDDHIKYFDNYASERDKRKNG